MPIGSNVLITGKIGIYALDDETKLNVNWIDRDSVGVITGQGTSAKKNIKSRSGSFFGFGISVGLSRAINLRVRWERFIGIVSSPYGLSTHLEGDIDRTMLDIIYKL